MKLLIALIAGSLFLGGKLAPADVYTLSNDFEFIIKGTSNVHDWEEHVSKINAQGAITWNSDGSFNLSSLEVLINAGSIKSTNGSIMDKKTYAALKVETNPTITFKLVNALTNVKPGTSFIARGELNIAGVSKMIDLPAKVSGNSSKMLFEGTKSLNMTDFEVAPPTAFAGAMKVGDKVDVTFKTSFIRKITPEINSN
jgi:hypothetical protein